MNTVEARYPEGRQKGARLPDSLRVCFFIALWSLCLAGCSSSAPTRSTLPEMNTGFNDLSLGLYRFEANSSEVADVERDLVPMRLLEEIQKDETWGAVYRLPTSDALADVLISGHIIASTGHRLVLTVDVSDVSGKTWFHREYKAAFERVHFDSEPPEVADLYARIARDLRDVLHHTPSQEAQRLVQIREMRFARSLLPGVYDAYLSASPQGQWQLKRLPSGDDAFWSRIQTILARDDLLKGNITRHYQGFQKKASPAYLRWRAFAQEEEDRLALLKKKNRWSPFRVLFGGLTRSVGVLVAATEGEGDKNSPPRSEVLFEKGDDIAVGVGRDLATSLEALRLSRVLLDGDLSPTYGQLEGRVYTLTGNAEAQYQQFQDILRRLYLEETGFDRTHPTRGTPD